MGSSELVITKDLFDALRQVLGAPPAAADPVVVVAACLDSLAKGHGLFESMDNDSDPLELAGLPAPAMGLLHALFDTDAPELEAETVRDGLYQVFVALAQDRDVRRALNRNRALTEAELLGAAQVYWNLEATGARDRLPIRPRRSSRSTGTGARTGAADIPVPGSAQDFATMTWTDRCGQGYSNSSGQGFRTRGARLAALAARLLVRSSSKPLPDLEGPELLRTPAGRDRTMISISWPGDDPVATSTAAPRRPPEPVEEAPPFSAGSAGPVEGLPSQGSTVRVGAPAEVGADYQRRRADQEIERLWEEGGDRRVWLSGGPGLGKSYSARRVMQEALRDQGPDRDDLLVWVDSADPASTVEAIAAAVDQLRLHGVPVPGGAQDPADRKARALLGLLATSAWRWLVVLDNADAGPLIEAGLVPPGGNPNGRVLLTTLSRDHRLSSHGRVVVAELFTAEEAEAYLRSEVHSRDPGQGPLARASRAETRALAETVGRHPLALSVAAATIAANAMTVADWIAEFTEADRMDAAADEPDRGGYPHLVGATWRTALGRASEGLPVGTVERAAMVAALQDPDGHPTWLWDREPVAGWVAGRAPLVRRHGVPVAVQRLIDHGIVELRGGTWRGGQVAIHQLAARAVRELAAPADLAELAAVLLEQWLLAVTGDPDAATAEVLHRSIRPIAAFADLPEPARRTATALLAYRQPTGSGATQLMAESIEPYLDRGGATARIELAGLLAEAGDEEAALGRAVQARTEYGRAAALYRQLAEDRSLAEDELAKALQRLGDLQAQLGNPEQARASRERAARLLERLADAASDTGTTSRYLARLVLLHDLLGDQDRRARTLTRAQDLLARPPEDLPSSADPGAVLRQGSTWKTLAALMVAAGRLGAAKDCLSREAALYERFPEHGTLTRASWAEALQALALLHARTGEWADAEHCLTRLTDIRQMPRPAGSSEEIAERQAEREARDALVLLASVQAHLGRRDNADQNLARAARQYREHAGGDGTGPEDLLDSMTDEQRQIIEKALDLRLEIGLMSLGETAARSNRWEEAAELFGSSLDLAQQAADAAGGDAAREAMLAEAHEMRGWALTKQEAWDDAATHYQRALGIRDLLAGLDPGRADAQLDLAQAFQEYGDCLDGAGRHPAAADAYTMSGSAYRRALELAPDDRAAAAGLATALRLLAQVQAKLGNLDDAIASHEESISIRGRLAGQAPGDRTAQLALAEGLQQFGAILLTHDQPEAAVGPLRRARDSYSDVVDQQATPDFPTRKNLAFTQMTLGLALARTGQPQDAASNYTEAVNGFRALADRAPDDREVQDDLAVALAALSGVHADNGRQEEAADCLTRSANILQLLADLDPGERPSTLIVVLNELARVLRDLDRTDEADHARARAAELAERHPEEGGSDDA